jgi:hypothetical protein
MAVAYPELGGPGQGRPMYREGDELDHPSGARYKRVNGHWVCIQKPGEGEPR